MKVLVCGGRDFDDYELMLLVLDQMKPKELGHGDARGADSLAQRYAEYRGVPVRRYPADWDRHGRSAGPIRNREMFKDFQPDIVVAFPGGRGTADMVSVAQKAKCKFMVIDPDDYIPEFYRAAGDCICGVCKLPYRKHPFHKATDWQGEPFLHVLCNGENVKL